MVANGCGGGEGCDLDDKCENPGALPPFPTWEGVLATEIGEVGRTPNSAASGGEVDEVTRSITEGVGLAMPDFGISPIFERALAEPSFLV